MTPGATPKRHRFRTIHIVGLLACIAVAFLLRLATQGLPQPWVDALSEAASTDRFALELDGVSVSLLHAELAVRRVRVYPKGVVHEAIVELEDALISLRPRRGEHPLLWIRSVRIGRLALPAAGLADGAAATASFTPTLPASAGRPTFSPVRLSCAAVEAFGIALSDVALSASATNGALRLADIRVSLPGRAAQTQQVAGHLEFDLAAHSLAGEARGRLDTARLVPMFRAIGLPALASEIERIGFPGAAPQIQLHLDYRPADAVRELRVDVKAGYCAYNGVPLTSAAALVRASGTRRWSVLAIAPLHLARPEGEARGGLSIDLDQHTLAFEADSTVDPLHLLRLIRVLSQPIQLPLGFDNPTRVNASGVFDFSDDPDQTDIVGEVRSPCVTAQGVQFAEVSARAHLRDDVWSVTNIAAQVYGGRLDATAAFTPNLKHPISFGFTCEGLLSALRHPEWASLLGPPEHAAESPGTLDLSFAIRGTLPSAEGGMPRSLSGGGRLELKQVRLFTIPLFAGLTGLLAGTIPGVDFVLSQDDLVADWQYADERLDIAGMRISGNVFSASASGSVFRDGQVDLLLKGHLLNRGTWLGQGLYYALLPISKMLEFRGTGYWKNPDWSPVNLPGGGSTGPRP